MYKEKKSVIVNLIVASIFIALISSVVYLVKKGHKWKSIEDECWAYVDNGFYERAIELDNSISDDDKSQSTHACIGTAYYNVGNLQLALQHFKKAEELEESILYTYKDSKLDFDIYTHIAKILHEMKRYDETIEYYNKALEKASDEKDRGDIFIKIAKVYEEKGDLDNAIKYYQDALVHNCQICGKEKAEIYKKIASLYERKGDKTQAERYLNKASELEQASNQNN